MEFSFSMEQGVSSGSLSRQDATTALFASVDGRAASLSNEECVFQARQGEDLHVMTHQVLQAMDHCREFRPVDEHIARITSMLPGLSGQSEAVRKVIRYLIDRQLLVSDESFLANLHSATAPVPAELSAIVVRACDRPQQLQRLLHSLRDHANRFDRQDRVVVVDDSRSDEAVRSHQQIISEFANGQTGRVTHLDANTIQTALQRLKKACPAAVPVLEALSGNDHLMGFGGGRGYNLALLISAGSRLALLDDDYQLPFHRASQATDGLEPIPATPFESRFHGALGQALAAGDELEEDGFALQERLLGNELGSVFGSFRPGMAMDRSSLRGRSLAQLAHLRSDARVLATYTGTRGASFTSDSLWLYRMSGTSREHFWADRDLYLHNIHAETMEFAPTRAIVRPYGLFTPFLLDNSQLLPCTANSGRGEDGLFGIAANYLYPDAVTLHLPITIGHVQEGGRGRFERALQPLAPGINRFLREWMLNQAQPARSEDAADRLQFLAVQLEDLANASQRARIEVLEEYLRYVRADLIEHLQQQLLSSQQAPVYWIADVRRIVEANGQALMAKAPPRLDEWPQDLDAGGCADRLRDACRNLAASYRVWPRLWQTAAEFGNRLLNA